ncbi:MAG TPA: hypothetical protein VFT50_18885 [Baekduia sp.]|nr:hypothetical protein [Baekduia sp.]
MRCRAVLGLVVALAAGGCTKDEPRMPAACTGTDVAGWKRALHAAPDAVRLPGGVPISTCTRRVWTDAELQELGTTIHLVAEDLAARARRGDVEAARRLGYLTGAVAAGAARSSGISSELARRVGVAGVGLGDGAPPVARALREGERAGAARG